MPPKPLSIISRRVAGFSLTEMLVVVGIITVMGTIVVSSFFRGRDAQRLTASEHLLAGAIRQARHTARSSGMPVALRLESTMVNNERIGITMSGQFRVPIWTETFDAQGEIIPPADQPANGLVIGSSGNGRQPSSDHPIPTYTFVRGQSFNRASSSTKTDGFFISCSVRPSAPNPDGAYVPLLLIGMSDQYDVATGDYNAVQAALALRYDPPLPPIDTSKIQPPVWEIVGGVYDENHVYYEISSKNNRVLLHEAVEAELKNITTPPETPFIVEANRWINVGLLYDGRRLYLYADDKPVAVRYDDVPEKLADGISCFVGQHTPDTNPRTTAYTPFSFDDIRISKLGQNDAMAFPDGVIFSNNVFGYRIMCHSNGRVEVFKDQNQNTQNDAARAENDNDTQLISGKNASDPSIILEQRLVPGTIQKTEITVSLDGRVTSRLITAPVSTPETESK
jgi:type II secretory pathway pseudopilin PulG